jgi:hypothetical protein
MSTFAALAVSELRHKRQRPAPRLWLIATILVSGLIALPADRVAAYPGGGALPTVGTIDDYVSQGQPRDRAYTPQGPPMGPGGQGFYGEPTGSRSRMNPAVIGAVLIGLWALQRYQERHQHHAMGTYRRSRHSRGLNRGYGF